MLFDRPSLSYVTPCILIRAMNRPFHRPPSTYQNVSRKVSSALSRCVFTNVLEDIGKRGLCMPESDLRKLNDLNN